jgi:signal transduction histidine kinase
MMTGWGVRARVMLVAMLPMLVLAIVLTAFYTSSRLSDLGEAHAARGQAFARQLAAASEYAVFSGNRESLQQLAGAILAEDDVLGVTIIDRDGETLARSGQLDPTIVQDPQASEARQAISRGLTLRIVEPILPISLDLDDGFSTITFGLDDARKGPPVLGRVVLDISRARLEAKRNELLRKGIGSVVLVLIGSLVLASYMSRGVTGPIRRVAEAVQRIGQGHFTERLPAIGGGSLGTLAAGVNEMAARLASAHEDLSRQVDEATAELRQRKDEAERANVAKSRFLAAASHDLRQPMHALGLFIAELAQQTHAPASRRLVERIAASAEAMENLLDSLLDISKLDAGVLQPSIRTFAVQPILERIAAEQGPVARAKGLRLKARPTGDWIQSDPVLFERILANLVSNAVRYSDRGGVLVACRRRGPKLRVEVRDSGVGIAPDAQEIVFQEFVQIDNPERSRDKGLGLGLAIVRRLTDLLGHGLMLRSQPGRGSVFSIDVPLAAPEADSHASATERQPGDLAGVRVVLVDDDPLALAGMQSLLESWGCAVIAATGSEELNAVLEQAPLPPELVISDFRLQGTANGIDIIRTTRARFGPDLPAVLISGDTGADTLRRAQAEGLPLLHKPVRPARLRALLNRLPAKS